MLGLPSVVVGGNKPVVLPLSSIYSPPFAFTSVTALKSKEKYTYVPPSSAFTPSSRPGHPKKEECNCVSCECSFLSSFSLKLEAKRFSCRHFLRLEDIAASAGHFGATQMSGMPPSYFDTWSHTWNNVLFSNHSHFSAEYLKSIPGQVISSWTQRVAKRLLRDIKVKCQSLRSRMNLRE